MRQPGISTLVFQLGFTQKCAFEVTCCFYSDSHYAFKSFLLGFFLLNEIIQKDVVQNHTERCLIATGYRVQVAKVELFQSQISYLLNSVPLHGDFNTLCCFSLVTCT